MATKPTIHQHSSGAYRVRFRFPIDGKTTEFFKSLKTANEKKADILCAKIHETMEAIEKGYLPPPSAANLWNFLLTGGKVNNGHVKHQLTLQELFDKYLEELPKGTLEESTLETHGLHTSHLLRIIGEKTEVASIRLKEYIKKRSQEQWHGKTIGTATIKKEVATLRKLCNWAAHPEQGYLDAAPIFTKLAYAKGEKSPHFMTWSDIEERVAQGAAEDLWNTLFLDTKQIDECLAFVKEHAAQPFVYPMFCFVAKTSARPSEMMRCRLEDVYLKDKQPTVVLREKKKDKSVKETFRRLPMPATLVQALKEWLKVHPGGPLLFCIQDTAKTLRNGWVSGHKREAPEKLTKNVARYWFDKTLKGSKWEVLKGFHTFRHSYASNLASAGTVDQRIIDKLMGHQTEEMRERYQHLFPAKMQDAVLSVYQ